MVHYCTAEDCLRSYILSYFGETAPEVCENCGNCRGKYEKADITPQSKVLLTCISQVFGKGCESLPLSTLIRLLQGFPVPQILELGLQELPFYGRYKTMGSTELHKIAEAMAHSGVLVLKGPKELISLTDLSHRVLEGTLEVTMLRRKAQAQEVQEISSPLLMDALQELRRHLAVKAGIPPESVFSQASLREMAKKKPKTLSEFKKITGVGEIRTSWHGSRPRR